MNDKLTILFLAANPADTDQLKLDEEMRAMDQTLRAAEFRDRFDLRSAWAVRYGDLQELLLRYKPHIVHFSGHGSEAGEILLPDNAGNKRSVSTESLAALFGILKDNVRCVVLNACYSETQAQAIAEHIACVVGMSRAVTDSAAVDFASGFYLGLGYGRTVKEAFDLGCNRIDLAGLGEADIPQLLALRDDAAAMVVGAEPYKGLAFYDAADAALFFGREALTDELVTYLKSHRFLAVVGASGSGKSSVVRAGVVVALQKGALKGSDKWTYHVIKPATHPLESLAIELVPKDERKTVITDLMDDMAEDSRSLHLQVRQMMSQAGTSDRLLLVVDQFEELFTLCKDQSERKAFVDNLLTAATDDGVTTVILTLRADFYAHCAQFDNLRLALAQHQNYIGAMDPEELRAAIEKPAEQGGWDFEHGLVDTMLDDVAAEPGALPLLSQALLETWNRRHGRTLTFAGYHGAGGVKGAIGHKADSVYGELPSEQQAIARTIFVRLTSLGEGTQDTRRRVSLDELVGRGERAVQVQAVLKLLEDARLVTAERERLAADGEEIQETVYVDVTHEALIRKWPTLDDWLHEDRAGLLVHRRLTEAADEWERLKRDPGALLRGVRLAQTAEWAKAHGGDLNDQEREFLDASQEQAAAEQREKERIQREREEAQQRELEQAKALAAEAEKLAEEQRHRAEDQTEATKRMSKRALIAISIGVVAIALALLAGWFKVQADKNSATAVAKEQAANRSAAIAKEKEQIAVQAEASAVAERAAAQEQLIKRLALEAKRLQNTELDQSLLISLGIGKVFSRSIESDASLIGRLTDELQLVTHLRDNLEGQINYEPVADLAFSPKGLLASVGKLDDSIIIWDTNVQPIQPMTLTIPPDPRISFVPETVTSIAWTHHGEVLGFGDGNGRVGLWQLGTAPTYTLSFGANTEFVSAAAISADDRLMATGSCAYRNPENLACTSGEIILWDIATRSPISVTTLPGHNGIVEDLAFHPSRPLLASAGCGLTYLFSIDPSYVNALDAGQLPETLREVFQNQDRSFTLTTNAKITVTQAGNRWEIRDTGATYLILYQEGTLNVYGPSMDNARCGFGEVLFWDTARRKQIIGPPLNIRGDLIRALAFSPDGRTLAGGSQGGRVVLWTLDEISGTIPIGTAPLSKMHTRAVNDLVYSTDGSLLASSSCASLVIGDCKGGEIFIWDTTTNESKDFIYSHSDAVNAVTFHNNYLASGGADGQVILRDLAMRDTFVRRLNGHKWRVNMVAFNPSSELLASAGDDEIYIWNVADAQAATSPLSEDRVDFLSVAFSPDGSLLAAGDNSGRLWRWETRSWTRLDPLPPAHEAGITTLAYQPNGHLLASGSSDQSIVFWDTPAYTVTARLQVHDNYVTSLAFSPDGQIMLSGSGDGSMARWDMQTLTVMDKPLEGVSGAVEDVAVSYDGQLLAATLARGAPYLWRREIMERERLPTSFGQGRPTWRIAFSPVAPLLVGGATDSSIVLWDTEKRLPIGDPIQGHGSNVVTDVAVSPDGRWLASSDTYGYIQLWPLKIDVWRKQACQLANRDLTEEEWGHYFGERPKITLCPD